MDYFYCPPHKISGDTLLIEGDEFSHLVHVMRKKEGDEIRVVDGVGSAYDVVLGEIKRKEVRGKIRSSLHHHNEPTDQLTLAVGVLKNPSKFDFLVEKATELGVREIIPLRTDRTIGSHAKVERWQKLALAAMKQACRSYLPLVKDLTEFDALLTSDRLFGRKLIAHEKKLTGGNPTPGDSEKHETTIVLVGPEGGFTEEEIERSREAGYVPVYLGDRRLRTETAAVVLAAAICLRGETNLLNGR